MRRSVDLRPVQFFERRRSPPAAGVLNIANCQFASGERIVFVRTASAYSKVHSTSYGARRDLCAGDY